MSADAEVVDATNDRGGPPAAEVIGCDRPAFTWLRDGSCELTVKLHIPRILGLELRGQGEKGHDGLRACIKELVESSEPCKQWRAAEAKRDRLRAERDKLAGEAGELDQQLEGLLNADPLDSKAIGKAADKRDELRRRLGALEGHLPGLDRQADERARDLAKHALEVAQKERARVLAEVEAVEKDPRGLPEAALGFVRAALPMNSLRSAVTGHWWCDGIATLLVRELLGRDVPSAPPPPPPPPPVRMPFDPPSPDVEITRIGPVTREGVR
jgi:hypothetical protein